MEDGAGKGRAGDSEGGAGGLRQWGSRTVGNVGKRAVGLDQAHCGKEGTRRRGRRHLHKDTPYRSLVRHSSALNQSRSKSQ